MSQEKIKIIQLKLTKNNLLILLTIFFISWYPKILGSETLTLTTYYPAPYGGYARLLTTNDTYLARDGGNVGIGTTIASAKLYVKNNTDTMVTVFESNVRKYYNY